jgi:hypothetical protein
MPKYNNSTDNDITIGVYRIPAKSDLVTSVFIEGSLPAGITLVSNEPSFHRILYSTKHALAGGANTGAINVPDSDTKDYLLTFYAESGEFSIDFNGLTPTPKERIMEGQTLTRKYIQNKAIQSLIATAVVAGTINIIISKS